MRIAHITDATLREGSQTVSGTFSKQQSCEIARRLAEIGVDLIECGHPSISSEEWSRVQAVVESCGSVPVLAHARLRKEDIESVAGTGALWVGVFIGVSTLSRETRVPWDDIDELREMISSCIFTAKNLGLKVRFTVEDATRTETDLIRKVFTIAADCGADRLCVSDTVGALEPDQVRTLVSEVKEWFPRHELECHFHDDRGLAMANALVAVDAGAECISTSVNGLGERAGITDTVSFIINQHLRNGQDVQVGHYLTAISERVAAYSRAHPDAQRPFVGANVFHHASKMHVRAAKKNPASYEIIDPTQLGRERSFGVYPTPRDLANLIVKPPVISATELRFHRHGPGDRYVMVDERFVSRAGQYCIARRIPSADHPERGHVDAHTHRCDSLFVFLGDQDNYEGLQVEVTVGDTTQVLSSPVAVFIPAGEEHTYRPVSGGGTYVNHVLDGSYEKSLMIDSGPDDGRVRE